MNNLTPFNFKAIIIVFMIFSLNLNAQIVETSFEQGPLFKKKIDGTYFSDFIGENDNGVYAIRLDSKYKENQTLSSRGFKRTSRFNKKSFGYESDLYIARYNKDLSLDDVYPLSYEGTLESIFMLNEKIFVITSELEDDESGVKLFGHILNETDFDLTRRKKLTSIKFRETTNLFGKTKMSSKIRYELSIMEDEDMFVIYKSDLATAGKFIKLSYATNKKGQAFDTNLRRVREEQDFMENTLAFIPVVDRSNPSKKFNPNDAIEYSLTVYDNADYSKYESYSVEINRYLVPGKTSIEQRGNKVYISGYTRGDDPELAIGYYMLSEDKFSYDGIFTACFDLDKKIFDYADFYPFSKSFLTKVMTEKGLKKLRKEGPGITNLRVVDFLVKKGGGTYMIAEIFYRKETTASKLDDDKLRYNFFYKDIIVVSTAANGEIEWMRNIDKNHKLKEYNWHYGSCWGIVSNDNLFFVYNDLLDNKKIESGEKAKEMTLMSDKVVMQAHVSPEGKVKKTILSKNTENYRISSMIRTQLSEENSVILFADKGTKRRLVRVKFGE
jgi:hypothetical protein